MNRLSSRTVPFLPSISPMMISIATLPFPAPSTTQIVERAFYVASLGMVMSLDITLVNILRCRVAGQRKVVDSLYVLEVMATPCCKFTLATKRWAFVASKE